MPKLYKLMIVAVAAGALSGCASISQGAYQKIEISSNPENALCKIYRDGQGYLKSVATPGETYIRRDSGALTVTCSKAGFKTASVTEGTEQSGDNIGNFATLGTGFLFDLGNQSQFNVPDSIHVNLSRE